LPLVESVFFISVRGDAVKIAIEFSYSQLVGVVLIVAAVIVGAVLLVAVK
jgi:hypothetical protein